MRGGFPLRIGVKEVTPVVRAVGWLGVVVVVAEGGIWFLRNLCPRISPRRPRRPVPLALVLKHDSLMS